MSSPSFIELKYIKKRHNEMIAVTTSVFAIGVESEESSNLLGKGLMRQWEGALSEGGAW